MNKNKKFVVLYTKTTGLDKKSDYVVQLNLSFYEFDELNKSFNKERDEVYNIKPKDDKFTVSDYSTTKWNLTKESILQHDTSLKDLLGAIQSIINEYNIITFNGLNFDIQFLYNNFLQYGIKLDFSKASIIDTYKIEMSLKPNTLESIFNRYDDYNVTIKNLYKTTGINDNLTILDQIMMIYQHQLSNPIYNDMHFDFNLISPEGFIYKKDEGIYIAAGKYKDKDVYDIYNTDPLYLQWIYKNLSELTKLNIINYLKTRLNK